LLLVALLHSACAQPPRQTLRLIEGQLQPTRFVSPSAYEHYVKAELELGRNRPALALAQLKLALAFDPSSPYLNTRLAEAYLMLGHTAEGKAALSAALEQDAAFPDALFLLGTIHQREKHTLAAAQVFRRAIDASPGRAEGYLAYSRLLIARQELRLARAVLERMVARVPRPVEGHQALAMVCIGLLDYRCAAEQLERALPYGPEPGELLRLSHVYQALGQFSRAIALLREAFDRTGGNFIVAEQLAELLRNTNDRSGLGDLILVLKNTRPGKKVDVHALARLMIANGQPKESLTVLDRAKGDVTAHDHRRLRAWALYRSGKASEAMSLLRMGAKQEATADEEDFGLYAVLLDGDRRIDQALDLLRRAVKRYPSSINLITELTRQLARQKKLDEAESLLSNALGKRSGDASLTFALATVQQQKGNWRKSIETIRQLLERDAENAAAHNFIGYTLVEQGGDLDQAARALERAHALQPGAAYVIDSLGWLAFKRGNPAEATRILQMAANLSPDEAEVLGHLAEVLAASKRYAEAQRLLKRAIQLCQDRDLAERLRHKLKQVELHLVGIR
jgi:tetratricopeptide (TPR) repeat protein